MTTTESAAIPTLREALQELVSVADACADTENTGMMDAAIESARAALAATPALPVPGPGTPSARLEWLLSELAKRFPDAEKPFAADPPELRYLAALDAISALPVPGTILTDKRAARLRDLLTAAGNASFDCGAHNCDDDDGDPDPYKELAAIAKEKREAVIDFFRAALAAPATVDRNAVLEVADEGAEILRNLIESIEQHGNYSAESTVGFLNQAKQCFDEIRAEQSTDKPAEPRNHLAEIADFLGTLTEDE